MNPRELRMNHLSIKLGYWSALLCAVTFLVFTVCFVTIALINPIFTWTNLQDFITYETQNNQFFKYLAQFAMLVFGVSYIVLLGSILDYADNDRKVLARIGAYFGIAFVASIGINYFLQISAVRLDVLKGQTEGLEQFIQS